MLKHFVDILSLIFERITIKYLNILKILKLGQ